MIHRYCIFLSKVHRQHPGLPNCSTHFMVPGRPFPIRRFSPFFVPQSVFMSTTTAAIKPTNRFLEVTQRFANRLPCSTTTSTKRRRSEAVAHLCSNVSAVLFLEGRPQFKRRTLGVSETKADKCPLDDGKGKANVPVEERPIEKKTNAKLTSHPLSEETLMEQDLARQKEELSSIEKEIAELEATKKEVLQEVVDVIGAYQFGLSTISTLTDLSAAPDAIMPGNF